MKRNLLYPPLLLEAIIKANDWHTTPDLVINLRKFHKMIEKLKADYEIDFGFADLLDFSESFYPSRMIIVEEYELHLHNTSLEKIRDNLEWYNRMYDAVDQVNEIRDILKKLK